MTSASRITARIQEDLLPTELRIGFLFFQRDLELERALDGGLFGGVAPGEFDGVVVFEGEENGAGAEFGGDELVEVEDVAVEGDDIHANVILTVG